MGLCSSCCGNSDSTQNLVSPDPETRRRLQLEAAEKRMSQQEYRGIKDPEKVRRQQEKQEKMDQLERNAGYQSGGGLRWQVS